MFGTTMEIRDITIVISFWRYLKSNQRQFHDCGIDAQKILNSHIPQIVKK
jgi:hypothetical protein